MRRGAVALGAAKSYNVTVESALGINKGRSMQSAAVSKRRAGGAFLLSAFALIPLAIIAMALGMFADIHWLLPVFIAAQWAFPRSIVRYTPFNRMHVPVFLTIVVWLGLAWLFALSVQRLRVRRLWITAPTAVVTCVVIVNVVLHLAGFHVTLDGP
jgi:hypothetical protein